MSYHYQMFRVVDGKIIEEDEATFQEREKKALEGIVLPVSYTCLLCKNTPQATTTNDAGFYRHWKEFHRDENDDSSEDECSETGKTDDESIPEPSLLHADEELEPGKEGEEEDPASCEKTISASAKPLEPEHEDQKVDDNDGGYYPEGVFIVNINVIHPNKDFEILPSPDKECPPECYCMHEIKNKIPGEIIEDSCDCTKTPLPEKPNLDVSAFETCDDLASEDWGPMPELSPPCSPFYDEQIDDHNDDQEEETEEEREKLKKWSKKRKHVNWLDKRLPKRSKKDEAELSRPNLYDAMRRGERLWWCKRCDNYLKSIDLLKYHYTIVHNEDTTKINRFNIATWDLEIARTFTSPQEIELEYELSLLVPEPHIEQMQS